MDKRDERGLRLEAILGEAHRAARQAAMAEEEANGHLWFPCGFAWVNVRGDTDLARHCRQCAKHADGAIEERFYGAKGYPSGWQWWGPGHTTTQRLATYQVAARAFAEVLRSHGVECTVGSRMD